MRRLDRIPLEHLGRTRDFRRRAWIYWLLFGWNRCIEQALKLRLVLDGLRLSREKAEAVLQRFDFTDLSSRRPRGGPGLQSRRVVATA